MTRTLIILAGGMGRRLGGPKADLLLNDRPILEFMLDRLNWPGPTALSIRPGQSPAGAERFDLIFPDEQPDASPAQLIAWLAKRVTGPAVCLPVDMPLMSRSRLDELLDALRQSPDRFDAAMFRRLGNIEPLPLAMTPALAPIMEKRIASGDESLHGLANEPRVLVIDRAESAPDDDSIWTHLNERADIARSGLRITRVALSR